MSTITASRLAESSAPSTRFWSTPPVAPYARRPRHVDGEVGPLPRASRTSPHGGWAHSAPRRTHPDRHPRWRRIAGTAGSCRLDRQPAAEAAGPALPAERPHGRTAGDRRRPRPARPQPRPSSSRTSSRRSLPQPPPGQPGLCQGRHRHGRAEVWCAGKLAKDLASARVEMVDDSGFVLGGTSRRRQGRSSSAARCWN